jgi:hypothetical protein
VAGTNRFTRGAIGFNPAVAAPMVQHAAAAISRDLAA